VPFAELRGIRIYFEKGGDAASGRRLLSISGSGGDLRQPPGPFVPALADRFEMLAYDQRGLGQTDRPECDYRMADYAADALSLLDHVGWERAAVMGVSFGGMVAQELAVSAPERVERLVLACTSSGGGGGASYPLHELTELPPDQAAPVHARLMDTRGDDAGPAYRAILAAMAKRQEIGAGDPGRADGMRRQLEARRHHDTWDRLPRLRMPVLIAAGRYDGIAPPANQEALARQISGAELAWFDGGHAFLFQDATALPAIADFLAR
jgi:3-oxoadipate enol-lactonase